MTGPAADVNGGMTRFSNHTAFPSPGGTERGKNLRSDFFGRSFGVCVDGCEKTFRRRLSVEGVLENVSMAPQISEKKRKKTRKIPREITHILSTCRRVFHICRLFGVILTQM